MTETLEQWLPALLGFGVGTVITGAIVGLLGARKQASLRVQVKAANSDLAQREQTLLDYREENTRLVAENARSSATLDSERQRFQEQLQLLRQTRETLTKEFENLANRIFEDKQASFSRSSKLTLENTVDPLRREITQFRKKVEETYDKENAERNRLVGQISELQKQANRIGEDALQLANALKGDSKVQGNWGELVLERILEESGLSKGREYDIQVSLKDEGGQRRNPDVIVRLPDQRDIVIDAKVSLTDYERYCRADDSAGPGRKEEYLRQHLASIRSHVNGLNRKAYERLEGIRTLDFVLIFVPIEAAFMLALENDQTLFRDAYDKGIILVSPTTLLATLRTVHNIWRYEAQNRNAEEIAKKAGGLYDQLVLVVDGLDEVGNHLSKSRDAWETTRKRLTQGKGNLVKRFEDIKKLGAKARRQLPDKLVQQSQEDEVELPEPAPRKMQQADAEDNSATVDVDDGETT